MARADSRKTIHSTADDVTEAEADADADADFDEDAEAPSVADIAAATVVRIGYEARNHPLRTVAVAVGVGVVLGGGLPRGITRLGLVLGARVLGGVLLRRSLQGLGDRAQPVDAPSREPVRPRRGNGQYSRKHAAPREPD